MNVLDDILDGLEAELALERELGVRLIPCDLSDFTVSASPVSAAPSDPTSPVSAYPPSEYPPAEGRPEGAAMGGASCAAGATRGATSPPTSPPTPASVPLLFLHDRPLSPAGVEMMSKILTALGLTVDTAPILFEKPLPHAKTVVVLGSRALKKFLPTLRGAPGQWLTTAKGTPVLITYSPEYVLRFTEETTLLKIKRSMWASLKTLQRRAL